MLVDSVLIAWPTGVLHGRCYDPQGHGYADLQSEETYLCGMDSLPGEYEEKKAA